MAKSNITAVFNKRALRTNWGFNFNTDVQNYVENFMQSIHAGCADYTLYLTEDAPKGIYTDVEVIVKKNKNNFVKKLEFKINH